MNFANLELGICWLLLPFERRGEPVELRFRSSVAVLLPTQARSVVGLDGTCSLVGFGKIIVDAGRN